MRPGVLRIASKSRGHRSGRGASNHRTNGDTQVQPLTQTRSLHRSALDAEALRQRSYPLTPAGLPRLDRAHSGRVPAYIGENLAAVRPRGLALGRGTGQRAAGGSFIEL